MKRCLVILLPVYLFFVFTYARSQSTVFAELTGNPVDITGWQLFGVTAVSSDAILLVPNQNDQAGAIFYTLPIDFSNGGKFVVDFEFRMWDGNAADGIAFNLLDNFPPTSGGGGGGIGVPTTINGLRVVFDTYDNCAQGDNPEIQIMYGTNYQECQIPSYNKVTNANYLRSSNYQPARIVYDNGQVTVFVNCEQKISVPGMTISNSGYFGFSAATGGQKDNHSIKGLKIYTALPTSTTKIGCSKDTFSIGSDSEPNTSYLWQAFNNPSDIDYLSDPTVANPTFSMINDGDTVAHITYLLKTTVNSLNSCSFDMLDTIHVQINPLPKATLSMPKTACQDDVSPEITFSGSTNGNPNYTFTYTINNGTPELLVSSTDVISLLQSTAIPGTFIYHLTQIQDNTTGCKRQLDIKDTITIFPLPVAHVSPDIQVCQFDSISPEVHFWGTNGTNPYTFSYQINGADSQTISSAQDSVTISIPTDVSGVFTYTLLQVSDSNGCKKTTNLSTKITVHSLPDVRAGEDFWTCLNKPIVLEATGAESYFWDKGVQNSEPFIIPDDFSYPSNLYTVLGTDQNGCQNKDSIVVNFRVCVDTMQHDELIVYVPNAMTLNNDGLNDLFLPVISADLQAYSYLLEIYDRWGKRIFNTNDMQHGWDGTNKGKVIPAGVYTWKIIIQHVLTSKTDEFIGHVVLIY